MPRCRRWSQFELPTGPWRWPRQQWWDERHQLVFLVEQEGAVDTVRYRRSHNLGSTSVGTDGLGGSELSQETQALTEPSARTADTVSYRLARNPFSFRGRS